MPHAAKPVAAHRPATASWGDTGTFAPLRTTRSVEDILRDFEMPEPEVRTLRRFGPEGRSETERTEPQSRLGTTLRHDAAELDARAALAVAGKATMSKPVSHGPTKTVVPDQGVPWLEKPAVHATYEHAAPVPTPSASPASAPAARAPTPRSPPVREQTTSRPHVSDAPAPRAGGGPRIAVVQSDFNRFVTDRMAEEAKRQAGKLGASIAHHLHVPGVFDAPLAAKALLRRGDVDAVVVIGAVVQGETNHDEVITHACAGQLAALACQYDKPVGFGITGPGMTKAQAEARIGAGKFAVESVIQQWRTLKVA